MARGYSQMMLVGDILGALDKQGATSLSPRQMNAVIQGANLIIDAMQRDDVPATPAMGLAGWYGSDDTGLSSLYMAYVLGSAAKHPATKHAVLDTPRDPSDFGRCVRLLAAAPELRPFVGTLADPRHGKVWNYLADHWDDLERRYLSAVAGGSGHAPWLLALLRELHG